MIVKTPDRTYQLGDKNLPSLGQKVVSWPWGSTPNLTQWSIDQLKYPLGTIVVDVVDGHPVIAQIQTHDSYGAHPEWGIKLHKGTSVYVPVVTDETTGKSVAMKEAPEGWGVSSMAGWFHNRFGHREGREIVLERGEHMGHWREHVERIPKIAVLAAATAAGALISGGVGAVVGLLAGMVVDKEVRGGDWLPDFHGDFGIGTIIPSSGPKPYQLTDANSGQTTTITAKSMEEAANFALARVYGGATAVMRLPGTDTFQTDRGDTFRLTLAGA